MTNTAVYLASPASVPGRRRITAEQDLPWLWQNSEITAVIDGDTVHALVTRDIGFGGTTSFTVRLRLNRVNAPKATARRGAAAKAFVEAKVLGARVDITTHDPYKFGGPKNSPGEWMAEIALPDGSNLSDLLVAEGLAVPWDGEGDRPADA